MSDTPPIPTANAVSIASVDPSGQRLDSDDSHNINWNRWCSLGKNRLDLTFTCSIVELLWVAPLLSQIFKAHLHILSEPSCFLPALRLRLRAHLATVSWNCPRCMWSYNDHSTRWKRIRGASKSIHEISTSITMLGLQTASWKHGQPLQPRNWDGAVVMLAAFAAATFASLKALVAVPVSYNLIGSNCFPPWPPYI